jgi:energy-dependent translational throttle protein EttA
MSVDDKKIIYTMVDVGKRYGQKHILKNIYLSYFYGAKIGVLGLNGSGKSSLLKIMAGIDQEHLGEVHKSEGYSLGYLPQEPELDLNLSVKESVAQGAKHITDLLKEFDSINNQFAEISDDQQMNKLIDRQAKVQEKLDAIDAWTLDDRLKFAMHALRCPDENKKIKVLSGGERRRVALCRLLIQEPDILLLDEPTNHLDAASVAWLERHLQEYKGTVIAVTHDRYFLDNVAGWILELDRGQGHPFKGNYSSWLSNKTERLRVESRSESNRLKTLEREKEWVSMSPKARRAKNKARISSYEQLLSQSQEELVKDLKIYIPPGPRLGNKVIEAKNICKGFAEKKLYQNLSFELPPGGIVGIIGANGVGKTTLFQMIAGLMKPDQGEFSVGSTVKIGYMEQMRDALDSNKTIFETISEGQEIISLGKTEVQARSYVAQFNFTGKDQEKKLGVLSGGERNRVQLALLLKQESNLLLLDEPSNDLDINTLQALEQALSNFAGSAVVISHDRWFLDRIATHILAFEDDGKVHWNEGNYQDYIDFRKTHLNKNPEEESHKRQPRLTR